MTRGHFGWLRGLQGTMGRLLNIHAEMAHAPVVLAAYQGIGKAITAPGSFDAKTARQSRVMQLVADIWPEP